MIQFVNFKALLPPAFAQGFNRHIQTDLIAKLKTVRDRLGWGGDTNREGTLCGFNAFAQCVAGESQQPQRRVVTFALSAYPQVGAVRLSDRWAVDCGAP